MHSHESWQLAHSVLLLEATFRVTWKPGPYKWGKIPNSIFSKQKSVLILGFGNQKQHRIVFYNFFVFSYKSLKHVHLK